MILRSFLDRHGIRYEPDLRVVHDFDFYFDLLSAGARWIQLLQAYYLYWARPGSLSSAPDIAIREHAAAIAIRWVRGRPRDGLLVMRQTFRNMRLRLVRRIRNPKHPVPARVLERGRI
jgi:hypothetical protein